MTKPQSKPCICCIHYSNSLPCGKGHRPRFFKEGGLRRVCDDFATQPAKAVGFPWLDALMSIFGLRRV